MIRGIVILIEIIICFLLETTIFQWFALAGIVPNFLLILTVSYGFMRGKIPGFVVGIICGLMIDFMYGDFIGLYGIIYMTIGFINGYFHKIFNSDDKIIPVVLIGFSQTAYFFLVYIFTFLLRGRLNVIFYFITIGIPEIVYTTLISIFFYRILYKLDVYLDGFLKKEA